MPNPCSSGFLNINFCDLRWQYDKAIIKFWFHPHMHNMYSLQCTELHTVLYWKRMATEARVNTVNRFDSAFRRMQFCFIGFCFVFNALFTVFSIFWHVWHKKKKSHLVWNSVFFRFFPKFYEFVPFLVSWKTGDFPITLMTRLTSMSSVTFVSKYFCIVALAAAVTSK